MRVPTLSPATVSSVRLDGRSVAPQDPLVGDALRPGHLDEVLLERRHHVAAQQAHVHRDLGGGQRGGGQHHAADVLEGVLAERHVARRR